MSNIVYIATSLDGFIARKDGSLDWLTEVPNPDGDDFGFGAFMERIDAVVMGRNTFEAVVRFGEWPYTKPVFVLSTTMTALRDGYGERAEIIRGDLRYVVDYLFRRGYSDLYIDGGRTIQSFLAEDLIDELIITRVPVVLGSGIPLFADMDLDLIFEHAGTEVFNDALVKSTYRRKR